MSHITFLRGRTSYFTCYCLVTFSWICHLAIFVYSQRTLCNLHHPFLCVCSILKLYFSCRNQYITPSVSRFFMHSVEYNTQLYLSLPTCAACYRAIIYHCTVIHTDELFHTDSGKIIWIDRFLPHTKTLQSVLPRGSLCEFSVYVNGRMLLI